MCAGCVRKIRFLHPTCSNTIMLLCVCVCMDTPGRVDYGVGAFASSNAMPAIAIHEVERLLVYDEACEQGPKLRGRSREGVSSRKKKEVGRWESSSTSRLAPDAAS